MGGCIQKKNNSIHLFFFTATIGSEKLIQNLLSHGANLNLKDWENGWTPLHRALYFKNLRAALLLIRNGAKLGKSCDGRGDYAVDKEGNTPLDLVSRFFQDQLKGVSGGDVYAFGKNDYQLGYMGGSNSMELYPKRVEKLVHSCIVRVAADRLTICD